MTFRQLTVVMAMSAVVATSAAHAASSAEYLAEREKTTVTPLQTTNALVLQYPSHAGQVIELDGVVSDIIPYGGHPAFLLHIDPRQNLLVAEAHDDADIVNGAPVRVLARIPANGDVLEGISVTRAVPNGPEQVADPQTDSAQTTPATSALGETAGMPAASPMSAVETDTTPVQAVSVADVTRGTASSGATGHRRHARLRQAKASRHAVRVAAAQPRAGTFNQKVRRYASKIRGFNPGISAPLSTKIATHVLLKSQKYGVDPRLVFALIAKESQFNPKAVSPVGAQGLGQLMPGTAAAAGIHAPFDVAQNIEGTVRYLAEQLTKFGGNIAQALAAYNAGPGSVIRYGGVPPFSETVNYVRVISTHYQELKIGLL